MTNCTHQGTIVWRFLMATCIYQTVVNVSETDESGDEPVSESLDSCIERSFLSQRQCRLIFQQLRNSDLCLEENVYALMHGKNSDGRVCDLGVCAARDSPLTNTVRQRLHDICSAERWTSRDHDLSRTSGRRSALTNLDFVRPDHAVFFPPRSGFNVPISNGQRSDREKYIVYWCSLLVQKQLSFGDAHVVVECASGSLIPKFLRVTLDTFWESTNRFVHARFGAASNTFADLSKCSSCLLPSETAGGSCRENHGRGPNSTLCQRNSKTIDIHPW